MSKIALGSAQFGMKYGISNKERIIKKNEVIKILEFAKKKKIDLIDTAYSYGESEKVLGSSSISNFKLVSKLPSIPKDCKDVSSWVEKKFLISLKRLKIKSIYGLLIHDTRDIHSNFGETLIAAANRLKVRGLVKKIGVSIYDPLECDKLLKIYKFDIIQVPLNVVDQRIVKSGWLSKLFSKNIEIHTRSVFLQGLLLMPRKKIPKYFDKWANIFDKWSLALKKNNMSAVEACLLYPLSFPEIKYVVVGVENIKQLDEIIQKTKLKRKPLNALSITSNDQMLINPTNWKI